jgi:hypothetical protein
MRKILLIGVCTAVLCGSAHAQGITVNDPASIIQQIRELEQAAQAYVLQNAQYLQQIQQYANEVQQLAVLVETLEAWVHAPNLGAAMGLLNQAGLGTTMPVSPAAVMTLIGGFNGFGGGGIPNLAGLAAALGNLSGTSYAANHVYSPTDGSWTSQQLIANGNGINAAQGTALASYQQLQAHEQNLQALRTLLTTLKDPKDVADTQAEISLESLWTQNQHASIAALQVTAQTEDAARVQRDNESLDKSIDAFLDQAAIPR